MNFSRVPKWAWWVGGFAILLALAILPMRDLEISVQMPAAPTR